MPGLCKHFFDHALRLVPKVTETYLRWKTLHLHSYVIAQRTGFWMNGRAIRGIEPLIRSWLRGAGLVGIVVADLGGGVEEALGTVDSADLLKRSHQPHNHQACCDHDHAHRGPVGGGVEPRPNLRVHDERATQEGSFNERRLCTPFGRAQIPARFAGFPYRTCEFCLGMSNSILRLSRRV
jgi:hypothetical protein